MKTAHSKRIAHLLEQLTDTFFVLDLEWRFIYLNPQAEGYFQKSRRELLHQNIWNLFPHFVDGALYKACLLAKDEEKERVINEYDPHSNRWLETHILAEDGALYIFFHDISDRKREIDEKKELLALEQTARVEAQSSQQHYQAVAEAMPQIVWTAQPDGWMDYFNQQWFLFCGLTPQESEGWGWKQVLHPEEAEAIVRTWKQAVITGEKLELELRIRRAEDGSFRWHLARALPVRDSSGAIAKWIGTWTDIDDQKRSLSKQAFLAAATKITSSTQDYKEMLLSLASEAVATFSDMCVVDLIDPLTGLQPLIRTHHDIGLRTILQEELSTAKFSLIPENVLHSRNLQLVNCTTLSPDLPYLPIKIGRLDLQFYSYMVIPLILEGTASGFLSFISTSPERIYTKDDLAVAQELAYRTSLTIENTHLLESAQRELQERKQIEEALRHQAFHDTLTELPNRSLFKDRVITTLYRAERNEELCAIIFLDIDRFKTFNDSLGHHIGDVILQETAQRLQDCIRKEDTVARFGGDEFTILLTELTSTEDAMLVVEKILQKFTEPFLIEEREIYISVSLGIAIYPTDGDDANVLIKNADAALYRAKELGRGTYQLYTRTLSLKTSERLDLEQSLRSALEHNEFQLHYQPVVDLSTGMVVGAEALIRWQHPEFGLIFPNEFIPIAEDSDLILHLGDWVLKTVCTHLSGWSFNKKRTVPHIAINLSPRQFADPLALERIRAAISKSNVSASCLEVEITEGIAMQNIDATARTLRQLEEMGIRISLDDFGVGYSSLSYLKRFPLHALKIDRSFIQNCMSSEQDRAIIRAIISMAHSLSLKVIGEGVETQEQLSYLRSVGCNLIQGYLISPSLPPNLFYTFYRTKNRQVSRRLRRPYFPVQGHELIEGASE